MAIDVLMYEPTVYTVAEVAGFLRCSTRTIFNLIDREELACLKVGGLTRITAYHAMYRLLIAAID